MSAFNRVSSESSSPELGAHRMTCGNCSPVPVLGGNRITRGNCLPVLGASRMSSESSSPELGAHRMTRGNHVRPLWTMTVTSMNSKLK